MMFCSCLLYLHKYIVNFKLFSNYTPFVVSSDAPETTTLPRSEDIVNVGETLTLDCSFVGFPTPYITWTLNNSVAFLAESGISVDTSQSSSGSTFR